MGAAEIVVLAFEALKLTTQVFASASRMAGKTEDEIRQALDEAFAEFSRNSPDRLKEIKP